MIYTQDLPKLQTLGVTKQAVLLSDTPRYEGTAAIVYYFDARGDEVAHYFPDLRDFTGLVVRHCSWGGVPPEKRKGYEVRDIRAIVQGFTP